MRVERSVSEKNRSYVNRNTFFMATAEAEAVTVPPVTEAGSGAAAGVDEVTVLVDGT